MLIILPRTLATVLLMSLLSPINTSAILDSQSAKSKLIASSKNNESSLIVTTHSFILPSGNIACSVAGIENDALRCQICSGLNPMPPRPDNCEFDWGLGFLLSQQSNLEVLCISDTIGRSDYTLSYESIWINAGFECKSQTIGLTCKNSSGQGFFLSRDKWNVF